MSAGRKSRRRISVIVDQEDQENVGPKDSSSGSGSASPWKVRTSSASGSDPSLPRLKIVLHRTPLTEKEITPEKEKEEQKKTPKRSSRVYPRAATPSGAGKYCTDWPSSEENETPPPVKAIRTPSLRQTPAQKAALSSKKASEKYKLSPATPPNKRTPVSKKPVRKVSTPPSSRSATPAADQTARSGRATPRATTKKEKPASSSKDTPTAIVKQSAARRLSKKLRLEDLELALGEDSGSDKDFEEESSSSSEDESGGELDETTEDEDFCTPHRSRTAALASRGVKRSAPGANSRKKKATPAKKRSSDAASHPETPDSYVTKGGKVMTPRVPQRQHSQVPSHLSPIQEAQVRLHVSAVPDSLPCRENEFAEILAFTEGKISEGTGGCMYISGVPGTGKTATVMEVKKTLEKFVADGDVKDFKFIHINGMKLTEPNQAYVQIWQQLNGDKKKVTADHASNLLDKLFAGKGDGGSKRKIGNKTTVLLVDELDMLWNRKQSVLYNLFEWPTRATSKLVVLAIANTMDLPERIMMNRVSSRLGLTRLTFSPYTHQQLQEIVTSRLEGLEVFDKDALQLVARKVASLSGDARRALDICRRATEISERESKAGKKKIIVGISHVSKAHDEMFCSPKIMAIRTCSKYEQMFLRSIVYCFEKSGLEETSFARVFDTLTEQLMLEGLPRMNSTEGFDLCFGLSASRLILAEHGRNGPNLRIRLNVSTDDVIFALDSRK